VTTLLEAYLDQAGKNQQQGLQNLQAVGSAQTLQQHFEDQAQTKAAREAIAQSGGDPEKALQAVLKTGNFGVAQKLAPVVKLAQEQRTRDEARDAIRAVNAQTAPPPAAPAAQIAPDLPTSSPQDAAFSAPTGAPAPAGFNVQQRISNLQKLQEAYANHPSVVQRINSEIDRLRTNADKAPQTRTRISGDTSIQEEYRDGQWQEIGRGPRFSRSVVNVNAPSQEPLSHEAVRDLAIQSLYDPNATAGYRRDTTAMSRIANERQRVMKEAGVTSEDVVSGRAGFKADAVSLNKITPQYDAITSFEKTAIRNGRVLKDLADKVDSTGIPVVERWIRAGRKSIQGDEDVAKFDAQLALYRAEAARILTQPNLSGVLTDTARREMEHVIRGDASARQITGVVDLLERDFENRKGTLEEQIASIRARMRSRVAPGGASAGEPQPTPGAPAAPAKPPKPLSQMTTPELMEYRRRLAGGAQ
jgi:hypothetical protein